MGNKAPLVWPISRSKLYFYLLCFFIFYGMRLRLDIVAFPVLHYSNNVQTAFHVWAPTQWCFSFQTTAEKFAVWFHYNKSCFSPFGAIHCPQALHLLSTQSLLQHGPRQLLYWISVGQGLPLHEAGVVIRLVLACLPADSQRALHLPQPLQDDTAQFTGQHLAK